MVQSGKSSPTAVQTPQRSGFPPPRVGVSIFCLNPRSQQKRTLLRQLFFLSMRRLNYCCTWCFTGQAGAHGMRNSDRFPSRCESLLETCARCIRLLAHFALWETAFPAISVSRSKTPQERVPACGATFEVK